MSVTGTGVSTYPGYDETVPRFAIRTTDSTAGTVEVTAATDDPGGVVLIDGSPVTSGATTEVTGLAAGDEVSVIITDRAGTLAQSWIYLPAGFPAAQGFETIVDGNGVPTYVRGQLGQDMKGSRRGPLHRRPGHEEDRARRPVRRGPRPPARRDAGGHRLPRRAADPGRRGGARGLPAGHQEPPELHRRRSSTPAVGPSSPGTARTTWTLRRPTSPPTATTPT